MRPLPFRPAISNSESALYLRGGAWSGFRRVRDKAAPPRTLKAERYEELLSEALWGCRTGRIDWRHLWDEPADSTALVQTHGRAGTALACVSTGGQSIEAQRQALGGEFEREFIDEGVSGAILAADRPSFGKLLSSVREADTFYIYSLDRLGRDALDVQKTVRDLLNKGVTLDVHGLGPIGRGVGELIVAVLAQIADMERNRIKERCDAARASLAANGRPIGVR